MMSAIASTPDTDNVDTRDTNISIKLVTEEDSEEVIALLKKFFFKVRLFPSRQFIFNLTKAFCL